MRENYENKKFNYLTGLRPSDRRYAREILWVWKCECGSEITKRPSQVKIGFPKSCGCKTKELVDRSRDRRVKLPQGEAAFRELFRSYKFNAEKRNYDFELSMDEFKSLTKQNCYYCGDVPSTTFYMRGSKINQGNYVYNGVDRLDNHKGYIQGNVVPCCGACNIMKGVSSLSKFLSKIENVYKKHSSTISLLRSDV